MQSAYRYEPSVQLDLHQLPKNLVLFPKLWPEDDIVEGAARSATKLLRVQSTRDWILLVIPERSDECINGEFV